jgi:predicted Zn-dependent protease
MRALHIAISRVVLPSLFAATAACATNPATGQRQLALISESQEIQIGRQAAEDVQGSLGLVDDAGLQAYVQQVGKRLAARSERPDLPWQFQAVDDPTPNAFALPGGFIYITRGMMTLLTSEAELAAVLGHEIGHVTARHAVNQISKQQVAQLGLGLGSIVFSEAEQLAPALGAGLDLLFLKYGRDDEREADELGDRYMRSGNYAVSEAADVFAALERAGGEQRSGLPTWLSTHPAPAERVEAARARAATAGNAQNATVGRDAYLQQIDNLPYGENPRLGFFQDGVFYHPELRFQVRFPEDWPSRNFAQAVASVAPGSQAAVELTLAGSLSSDAALGRFLAQDGIRTIRTTTDRINGLQASLAEFEARANQGSLQGIVGFVRHRDRTYQILGYTSAAQFDRYDNIFMRTIESFGPVNDSRILSVQPKRIDVVRVDRDQTLAQFARSFPSAVPVQQLAILNHVPGGEARLEARTLVKRVVG